MGECLWYKKRAIVGVIVVLIGHTVGLVVPAAPGCTSLSDEGIRMDGNRFGDLSRALATGISRRRAIKGVAAGLLGALRLHGASEAQVSKVQCGNAACANSPGTCK